MKSLIFSSYLFAFGLSGIAQTLQIGNAAVGSTSHGSLFRTPSGQSLYEAPINSGLTTIYESQFWVGYRQSGVKHAIMPLLTSPLIGAQSVFGPQTNLNAYSPAQLNGAFNKTWDVYSDSLDYHRANYLQNPYTPPKCVSEYVAVGDTAKGVHPFLLPFEAADDDGLYSWQRGDVPVIGGKKSLFALYSDRGVSKPAGNSETDLNVSVELYEHPLASVSDAHANSVFARFRVTNTGPTSIDSLLIGLVADPTKLQKINFCGSKLNLISEQINGIGSDPIKEFPPAKKCLVSLKPIKKKLLSMVVIILRLVESLKILISQTKVEYNLLL